MAKASGQAPPLPMPQAPRVVGLAGLWMSVAALAGCIVLAASGAARGEHGSLALLAGLVFAPVAALGAWLFGGFMRLDDWRVAPEVPLGLKLLGHLGRVAGSLAAAACLALIVLAIAFPGNVPPHPMRITADGWARVEPDSAVFQAARPGLAALYLLGFFASLLVRSVASGVSELRRWARWGSLVVFGGAAALLTVALVLNLTQWRLPIATLPLAFLGGFSLLVFLFLLGYYALPATADAFEAEGL